MKSIGDLLLVFSSSDCRLSLSCFGGSPVQLARYSSWYRASVLQIVQRRGEHQHVVSESYTRQVIFCLVAQTHVFVFPAQISRRHVSGLRCVLRIVGLVDYLGHPQPPPRRELGCTAGGNRDPPVWPSTQAGWWRYQSASLTYVGRLRTTCCIFEEMRNVDLSPHIMASSFSTNNSTWKSTTSPFGVASWNERAQR